MCRICDKAAVEEIFFGNEDEGNARFIELDDCKHIIEVNGLIQWMNAKPESSSDSNDNNSIQLKKCPKCKTIIRSTKALNTYIQASLRDIQEVKLKVNGDRRTIRLAQETLYSKIDRILNDDNGERLRNDPLNIRSIYTVMYYKMNPNSKSLPTNQQLIETSNIFDMAEKLLEIGDSLNVIIGRQPDHIKELTDAFEGRLRIAVEHIRQFKNSAQQRNDISIEILQQFN